jgi:dihydrofolate synthase/folylpolyglutamate synthase
MDGAHNPPAAEQLHLERRHWPGEEAGVNWILGIQAHKQAMAMIQTLLQPQDRAWIVPVPDHNSWTLEALLQRSPQWTHQLISASSVEQALVQINTPEQRKSAVPVLAGSLYLIGDLLARAVVTAE